MSGKSANKRIDMENADAAPPRLMSFAAIRRDNNMIWPVSQDKVLLQSSLFSDLLHLALKHVKVDEQYYLALYPDVSVAVEKGLFNSPRHHYITFGYFEDRLPFEVAIDEEFYCRAYPDVKASLDAGALPSARYHFERNGFKEGRLPREGWSLLTN